MFNTYMFINLDLIKYFVSRYKFYFFAVSILLILLLFYFYLLQRNAKETIVTSTEVKNVNNVQDYIYVDIEGAVVKPGFYKIKQGTRVGEALIISGGLSDLSDIYRFNKTVNQAKILADGDKLYVPYEWEFYESTASIKLPIEDYVMTEKKVLAEGSTSLNETSSLNIPSDLRINVNTGSKDALLSLSGIGEVYANKIINGRPYNDYQDMVKKSGVPSSILNKIQADIVF